MGQGYNIQVPLSLPPPVRSGYLLGWSGRWSLGRGPTRRLHLPGSFSLLTIIVHPVFVPTLAVTVPPSLTFEALDWDSVSPERPSRRHRWSPRLLSGIFTLTLSQITIPFSVKCGTFKILRERSQLFLNATACRGMASTRLHCSCNRFGFSDLFVVDSCLATIDASNNSSKVVEV